MHSTLTPELEEFRQVSRAAAERNFRKYAEMVDRGESIPHEVGPLLAEMGAYGLPFPAAVGGGDGTYLAWALIHEGIGRVLPALGLHFQVNTLVAGALLESGTPEQIDQWVPALLRGEKSAFLAFTEPQTGSDVNMLTTRAERIKGGGWRLTGQKRWISNARSADVGIVFAKDPADDLSLFLVTTDAPGFSVGAQMPIMGLRGTELTDVYLDGVEVPDENVLGGGTGGQFATLRKVMPIGKIGMCALCVGLMETCLEESVRYAREREQQGHPIIDFQAIHHLIAEMVSHLEASRQLTYWAATCKDQGSDAITELATAKLFVTNATLKVARMAVSVHGVYGIAEGMIVERLFRDAQIFELLEGTSEVHRELVMRAVRDIT